VARKKMPGGGPRRNIRTRYSHGSDVAIKEELEVGEDVCGYYLGKKRRRRKADTES